MDLLALFTLKIELRRWQVLGHRPVLWWRDDDAREPTEGLERLLDLAAGLPLSLAVIPDGDRSALAARLTSSANITVSQHGIDHANRAAPGQPASEYEPNVRRADKAERIAQGRRTLEAAGLEPAFYTPPWNQIDPDLPKVLPAAGYDRMSAYDGMPVAAGLIRVDCNLDVMRWKGGARFRGWGPTLRRLTRLLRQRRRAGDFDRPIGLLTHHLQQDSRAWGFLEWFLAFTRRRFTWRSYEALAIAPVSQRD